MILPRRFIAHSITHCPCMAHREPRHIQQSPLNFSGYQLLQSVHVYVLSDKREGGVRDHILSEPHRWTLRLPGAQVSKYTGCHHDTLGRKSQQQERTLSAGSMDLIIRLRFLPVEASTYLQRFVSCL